LDDASPAIVGYGLNDSRLYLVGFHRQVSGGYEYVDGGTVTDLERNSSSTMGRPPVEHGLGTGTAIGTQSGLYVVGYDCPAAGDPDSAGFGCAPRGARPVALRFDSAEDKWGLMSLPPSLVSRSFSPTADGPRFAQSGNAAPESLFLLLRSEPLAAEVHVDALDVRAGEWTASVTVDALSTCSDGTSLQVLASEAVRAFLERGEAVGPVPITTIHSDGAMASSDYQLDLEEVTPEYVAGAGLTRFGIHCVGADTYLTFDGGEQGPQLRRADQSTESWVAIDPPRFGDRAGVWEVAGGPSGLIMARGVGGSAANISVALLAPGAAKWRILPSIPSSTAGASQRLQSAAPLAVLESTGRSGRAEKMFVIRSSAG
jgi:hypothetical protein